MKFAGRKTKGFTLIEIVMVIAILGIISTIALPVIVNLTKDARKNKEDYYLGAIRTGVIVKNLEDVTNK